MGVKWLIGQKRGGACSDTQTGPTQASLGRQGQTRGLFFHQWAPPFPREVGPSLGLGNEIVQKVQSRHHQATNRQSSMCTAGMNMNKHTSFFGAFLSNMHCHWRPETVAPLGLFSPRRHRHFRVFPLPSFPHSSHFASSPALPCRQAKHNVNKPATLSDSRGSGMRRKMEESLRMEHKTKNG